MNDSKLFSIHVNTSLLMQIAYALEARLENLNHRGSEPVGDAIACTCAALELVREITSTNE
jgi:hypothetical protein